LNNSLNHDLKERLIDRKEWANYFELSLKHIEINDKVSREFYKDKFFLSFILKLYFLPLNLIKFFSKIKTWHYYSRCLAEIEILKHEIEENEK